MKTKVALIIASLLFGCAALASAAVVVSNRRAGLITASVAPAAKPRRCI
ncbi:MAG TPA: hypothetical protein VFE36_00105 [Candidatus Baltobacteraceae bacterium]|nr:hypothetical protein [Candidatus Baltobacteraceae bacterium]